MFVKIRDKNFKYINKKLKKKLEEINPDHINIRIIGNITQCEIYKDGCVAIGLAICSTLDVFDKRIGINKAVGRTIRAYITKHHSDKIRKSYDAFPKTWTLEQARNVLKVNSFFKSRFFNYIPKERIPPA